MPVIPASLLKFTTFTSFAFDFFALRAIRISFRSVILPNQLAVCSSFGKITAFSVTTTSKPSVRRTNSVAVFIQKYARNITTLGRQIIYRPSLILIPPNFHRRIGHRSCFKLLDPFQNTVRRSLGDFRIIAAGHTDKDQKENNY